MQRKYNMDDNEKAASLLPASPEARELKIQLEQNRIEREAAEAISARRAFACRVVAVGFAVLFVILFCFKAVGESPDQRRTFSSSCMHATGGGVVGSRGALLHFDPRCTEELKEYFDQAYYSEVRRVSDQAIAYFKQLIARHGPVTSGTRGTVVFDIDETALSNMDGFFGPSAWSRFFGGAGANRCVRPHLEYDNLEPLRLKVITASASGDNGEGPQGAEAATAALAFSPQQPQSARRPLCNAPPLRATLDLYNFLYDNNYTVLFLTGRSEDARNETEANLAEAGYGRRCAKPAAASTSAAAGVTSYAAAAAVSLSSMAAADPFGGDARRLNHRRHLLDPDQQQQQQQQQQQGGVAEQEGVQVLGTEAALAEVTVAADTATTASSSSSSSSSLSLGELRFPSPPPTGPERCYAELLMREVGDDRLASVFKAEARARLVAGGGHVLVGNIGDQFSDLVGQAAATANFKLPNPVYTLL